MTRHGKNATASSFYSYHERKRDAKTSGWGTLHERLGADSVKPFDCCSLTLQPVKDPVITPQGYIFEREAVLEYILAKKKEIAKATKAWEKQCVKEAEEQKKASEAHQDRLIKKFNALEGTPAHPGAKVDLSQFETPLHDPKASASNALKRPHSSVTGAGGLSSEPVEKVKARGDEGKLSNMEGAKSKQLPSFWIPELIPTAGPSKLEKPSQKVLCPMSGKSLKMKELMDVKFTDMPADEEVGHYGIKRKVRFMCPVTHDALTNTTKCAYLKTSQSVVAYSVVERILKAEKIDPVNGKPIKDSDIVEIQRGGTGYSSTNDVKAKLFRPQLELQ